MTKQEVLEAEYRDALLGAVGEFALLALAVVVLVAGAVVGWLA